MTKPGQTVEQPFRQAGDAPVDRVAIDAIDVSQSGHDGREVEVVDRAVLERRLVGVEVVTIAGDRCHGHRPSREPWAGQALEPVAPDQQAPDARGEAEDLVEGHDDEIGPKVTDIEAVGRSERRGVDEDVPPVVVRLVDQIEGVLHAGVVGLRRKGEQVGSSCAGTRQHAAHDLSVESKLGRPDGDVPHRCSPSAGELADPVDRVVVVGSERKA